MKVMGQSPVTCSSCICRRGRGVVLFGGCLSGSVCTIVLASAALVSWSRLYASAGAIWAMQEVRRALGWSAGWLRLFILQSWVGGLWCCEQLGPGAHVPVLEMVDLADWVLWSKVSWRAITPDVVRGWGWRAGHGCCPQAQCCCLSCGILVTCSMCFTREDGCFLSWWLAFSVHTCSVVFLEHGHV